MKVTKRMTEVVPFLGSHDSAAFGSEFQRLSKTSRLISNGDCISLDDGTSVRVTKRMMKVAPYDLVDIRRPIGCFGIRKDSNKPPASPLLLRIMFVEQSKTA